MLKVAEGCKGRSKDTKCILKLVCDCTICNLSILFARETYGKRKYWRFDVQKRDTPACREHILVVSIWALPTPLLGRWWCHRGGFGGCGVLLLQLI